MRKVDTVVALAYHAASAAMQFGITTQELDRVIESVILENDATPSFKDLYSFPAAVYVPINSVVVRGIPGNTVLCDGDIVSVDIGVCYQEYHGDSAWTYGVGKLSEEDQRLMHVSEESLYKGLKMARAGNRPTDISRAIGEYVFMRGYSILGDYAEHGIGTSVHEDLTVPNLGPTGHGILLQEGVTLAVEPAVHADKPQTGTSKDGWGVVTRDGSKAVHFGYTVVVTNRGYEILATLSKEECPDNG